MDYESDSGEDDYEEDEMDSDGPHAQKRARIV